MYILYIIYILYILYIYYIYIFIVYYVLQMFIIYVILYIPQRDVQLPKFFGSKITTYKSLDETKNPRTSGTK
jgi:hypothetical protein